MERYRDGDPFFADITWHAAGDPGNIKKCNSSMAVALGVQNYSRIDTMLHITAAQYTREQTIQHLQTAYSNGIRNFLALRGDLPPDVRMTDYWIIWKSFRETQTRTISERWT